MKAKISVSPEGTSNELGEAALGAAYSMLPSQVPLCPQCMFFFFFFVHFRNFIEFFQMYVFI